MTLQERFEQFIQKRHESECWRWRGALQPKPSLAYGRFQISKGQNAYAHRVAYELYKGTIPDGLYVLHRCDVPYCVNPAHLFLGTYADNNADKEQKGRANHAKGLRNANAKLSPDDVFEIRGKLKQGFTAGMLARMYGVSKSSIKDIRHKRSWAWMP